MPVTETASDRARPTAEVYLVPGFLGFERLGTLDYYLDVPALLIEQLAERGIDATVHATSTLPAGNLRKRAGVLITQIADLHDTSVDSVHLIGHSTGGLDVRLLLSPGSTLDPKACDVDEITAATHEAYCDALEKVRSATGVATPHHGAPVADLAVRASIDAALRPVGAVAGSRLGRFVISAGLSIAGSAARAVGMLPGNWSFLNWIAGDVLQQEPGAVLDYLVALGEDVGALRNLIEEVTDLANALLIDRDGVAYGDIVTAVDEPTGWISTTDVLLRLNTLVFRAVWGLTARANEAYPYPDRLNELRAKHWADRSAELDVGTLDIDARTNDGIVPTLSQPHGEILGVFASDHLDCVGHFPHTARDGSEVSGWVRSGAGFTEDRFRLLWSRVADHIAASV